ncbi:MAG: hypothetical protein N3G18_04695 [Candidatus Saccharicenans sp.]|nr:hypothetical protein [Candidatus Saccharicenans sp.]
MERNIYRKPALSGRVVVAIIFCLLLGGNFPSPPQTAHTLSGIEVVRARAGNGPDELGVITPEEANPEGPMSFVVSADGEIYVLDQANSRVQVFKDGRRVKTIPVPGTVFIDLELLPGRLIALLDNVVDRVMVVIEESGRVAGKISLIQEGITEPGAITSIYARSEGKWPGLLAQMDSRSILLAGLDGRQLAQLMNLPGLLNWNGQHLLKVEMEGEKMASVLKSDEKFRTWTRYRASFRLPLGRIYGVWDDKYDNIYLAANCFDEKKEINEVIIFEPGGRQLARIQLFVSGTPHEINNPVRVTPEGVIYQLAIDGQEVVIRKYND